MASKHIKRARSFISKAESIHPQNKEQQFRRSECLKHAILALQSELQKENSNEIQENYHNHQR